MEDCVWYADDDYIFVEFSGRRMRCPVFPRSVSRCRVAVVALSTMVREERAKAARAEYGRLH